MDSQDLPASRFQPTSWVGLSRTREPVLVLLAMLMGPSVLEYQQARQTPQPCWRCLLGTRSHMDQECSPPPKIRTGICARTGTWQTMPTQFPSQRVRAHPASSSPFLAGQSQGFLTAGLTRAFTGWISVPGCHDQVPHSRCSTQQKFFSSICGDQESKIKVLAGLISLKASLLGS